MQHAERRVLVVDDQSPDGTGEVADALARAVSRARRGACTAPATRGLGRSYIDGISAALDEPVDVICQMDADLSHDPRAPAAI